MMTRTFDRRATLEWRGDVAHGSGNVAASSGAFAISATFPRLSGEPAGSTTPEELLAAAHAACFGIGLRSVIGQRGGTADRVRVTATLTAEKRSGEIRIIASHLDAVVEGLTDIDPTALPELGRAAEEGCTISAAIRGAVAIHLEVRAV
jgi:osmotically inducible protein OsmC